jgi:hypothetical protein
MGVIMVQRKCNCKDWKHYAPKLDSLIIFAGIHGYQNSIAHFDYCPWCGKILVEVK